MSLRNAAALGAMFCVLFLGADRLAGAQQVPSADMTAPTAAPKSAAVPKAAAAPAKKNGQVVKKNGTNGKKNGKSSSADAVKSDFIQVALNKSILLDINRRADEVVIGDASLVEFKILDSGKIFLFGRALGSTNIYVMSRGKIIHESEVVVTMDPDEVAAAIRALMPEENITVKAGRDAIFLTGKVRSATAAADALSITERFVPSQANIINLLEVQSNHQVLLRVKVAEVVRSAAKNLGASLGYNDGGTTNPRSADVDNGFNINVGPFTGAFGILDIVQDELDLRFTALETQGLARVLAEPSLVAISGETAYMLAGGEFPVPTAIDENNNITIEFKQYGVNLAFTPVVMSGERINLNVATEVSSLGETFQVSDTLEFQGLNVRRANTTVDLPSGGTLMIAGLMSQLDTRNVDGVPYVKDVPVLGTLFRNNASDNTETELTILVTAYLVNPTDESHRVASPTDGLGPSSDVDFYLLGALHKTYVQEDLPPWAAQLKGPYGYILE
ncbi:MAG: type II and III secretion system protein family protein [Magnetospiraceae bacterium]